MLSPVATLLRCLKNWSTASNEATHLEQYQFYRGAYLVPLDGTQYFTSSNVSCEHCLQKEHRSGEITFSHQALQGAIVHPDIRQVIPLMVEDIRNEDGKTKQDCEINAGKRFVERLRKEHSQLDIIVLLRCTVFKTAND